MKTPENDKLFIIKGILILSKVNYLYLFFISQLALRCACGVFFT